MVAKLHYIVSEFATQEDADSYDRWFRAKVEKAMASDKPGISSDQVLAEMDALIAQFEARASHPPV